MTVPALSPVLTAGDSAPWFQIPMLAGEPRFKFDKAGGRHLLLLFFGSAGQARCAEAIRFVHARRAMFDDLRASFFGITIDPEDERAGRIAHYNPGIHFFLDFDRRVSALYGAADALAGKTAYRPCWLLIDPTLRVLARFALDQGEEAMAALSRAIAAPPPVGDAPVITVANVFEPEFCRALIDLYTRNGGTESGFMREIDGKTVGVIDHNYKRRSDYVIESEELRVAMRQRLVRRLLPMIKRSFQFDVTRIERYIVACYDGATGGYFGAHRDNTTPGTAHRRFAVTINLNDEFDGGDLNFPEFGPRTFRAPAGGAIVFSCGLLHQALPVTGGRRFATLPFLYDDAAAAIRQANAGSIVMPPQMVAPEQIGKPEH